mmetsp:Transcript_104375/g.319575  ORF Transcript_104375/g.319575 Transcript_104375/m.319575 type:complete len:248 (+) Transcript_104375:1004-1747(+)
MRCLLLVHTHICVRLGPHSGSKGGQSRRQDVGGRHRVAAAGHAELRQFLYIQLLFRRVHSDFHRLRGHIPGQQLRASHRLGPDDRQPAVHGDHLRGPEFSHRNAQQPQRPAVPAPDADERGPQQHGRARRAHPPRARLPGLHLGRAQRETRSGHLERLVESVEGGDQPCPVPRTRGDGALPPPLLEARFAAGPHLADGLGPPPLGLHHPPRGSGRGALLRAGGDRRRVPERAGAEVVRRGDQGRHAR